MGLQVAVTDSQNQSGNYWRVNRIDFEGHKDKVCVINVAQYKDKTTRDAADPNNKPMQAKRYHLTTTEFDAHFNLADLDLVNQNLYTQAYEYLKTLDGTDPNGIDFSAATDVPVGGGAD